MTKRNKAKKSPADARIFNNMVAPEKGEGPKSLLFKNRIVKIEGQVNQEMANAVTTELLYLEASSPGTPITMLINSGGGSVFDGWAIIDVMNSISSPIHTCVMGKASSMAATILIAGEKGRRSAMPNARIMIHEATITGAGGQAEDVNISSYEMDSTRNRMLDFYVERTGASLAKLAKLMVRDHYMYGAEAVKMGIVDRVISFPDAKAAFNTVAAQSNLEHQTKRPPRRGPSP